MRASAKDRSLIFLHIIYLASLAVMVLTGFTFERLSAGLAMPAATGEGPLFCKELLSSGGEDDAMIAAFGLFLVPLCLRLIRFRRPVALWEAMLLLFCLGVVLLALFMASLDCAALFYTAFGVPDPLLALALMALPLSLATLILLLWQQ